MFKTCLIQYFKQQFFRNFGLVLAPWINFSHLFVSFTHPFPLYFLEVFRHEDHLGRVLFALIHFFIFRPTITTHPNCVFPSLAHNMHIVGHALDVLPFFVVIRGIWSIRTLNVVNKVCRLVFIGLY
jgi:hypothetical protein